MQQDDRYDTGEAASLKIYLLGPPKIILNGAPVDELTSVKAQGLLFYLAVTRRSHARATLAALLWGDLTDAAARANLRKALQHLRKPLATYLIADRDTLALSPGTQIWVDVIEFEAAIDAESDPNRDRLQRAVELYRGDFLEGFYVRDAPDFEDWWLSEQARLRERLLTVLSTLADSYARQADLPGAIASIRRLLNQEPWREEAQRKLMLYLARNGQRGAALAQFKICRQVLADELAVEPAEETTALYEQIRDDELAAPSSSPVAPLPEARPPSFLRHDATPAQRPDTHFVGYESQLDRLSRLLAGVLDGEGGVAFVAGEAGWGKTTLLREFSRRAQQQHPDLIVASGLCTTYTGGGDPYLPFRGILRMLSADVERQWDTGTITRDHALRLWHLLPEMLKVLLSRGRNLIDTFLPGGPLLQRAIAQESIIRNSIEQLQVLIAGHRSPGGAHAESSGIDQQRIFGECTAVLQSLAQDRPLLLVLDDLHWADSSSLSLLFHLGHRLAGSPILIVGTYRPENVSLGREGEQHPLSAVLAEFKRLFGDVWIELGHDRDTGRAFVNALIESEPNRLSTDFCARLARDTKGHPLFAVEMLRDMEERGYLYRDERGRWVASPTIAWDALPQRVEGVIERRVNRLDSQLRKVLLTASVEGKDFTAEVVAQVRGVEVADMVSLLSADLERRHHLVRAGGTRWLGETRISQYHFGHNLFQKYLYHTLDPVERAFLHEAVGTALEALYKGQTGEIAVRLARHFQEANRPRKAIEYLTQAGDASAQVYANAEAIAHYRQAIDLAEKIELDAQNLAPLYMRLGRVLELDSQFDRALATYEAMEEQAGEEGDRRMLLASLMARSTIQSVPTAIHDPERARSLGKQALALAGELGEQAAEAKILWGLSIANYHLNRFAAAVSCGERSLALARQLGLQGQTAHTLTDLGGFIYLYSGQIDQAIEALQEAGELWRDLGNTPMLADSLAGLCIAYVYAGEYEGAISQSQMAFTLSQSIENVWGQSYSRWTIGDAYRALGQYSRAIEASETCIEMGESAGFLASQTYTRLKLAAIYGDLGEVERGIQLAQMALRLTERHLPAHIALALGILAHLCVLQGDLGRAEQVLGQAHKEASRESWAVFYLPVLATEAELGLRLGDFRRALVASETLVERLRRYHMRSGLPEALYLQGKALLGLGREETARDRFLDARDIAKEIGSQRMLWRVLNSLAQLESAPYAAEQLQRRARQIVETIANNIDQADLRRSFLALADVQTIG